MAEQVQQPQRRKHDLQSALDGTEMKQFRSALRKLRNYSAQHAILVNHPTDKHEGAIMALGTSIQEVEDLLVLMMEDALQRAAEAITRADENFASYERLKAKHSNA